MSLEDLAKKSHPYIVLGTTAGMILLGHNPSFAQNFYSYDDPLAKAQFFVKSYGFAPLGLATLFYLQQKIRDTKTTFLEPSVKNKYSFLNLQNIVGAGCLSLASSQAVFQDNFTNLCYLFGACNMIGTSALKVSLNALEKFKPPHGLNALKVANILFNLFRNKIRNTKELEKGLEELKKISLEEGSVPLALLSLIHDNKEDKVSIDDAFSKIEVIEKRYETRNWFTFISKFPKEIDGIVPVHLLFRPNNITSGKSSFYKLNLSEFMQYYEQEIKNTKSPEAQLLYSLFLDRLSKDKDFVDENISFSRRFKVMRRLKKELGEGTLKELIEAKANKEWQKVIERIVQDERFQSTQESIESKKVYKAGVYPILKTAIVVKEDERSVLESELKNLNYLKEQIKNTDFEAANALRIMEVNGKSLLVERHSSGKRLTEILNEKEDFKILSKVVEYLKLMHDKMPISQRIVNPEEELISILRKAQLNDKTKQIIYDGIKVTLPNLSKSRVFDCDAHSDNWFVAGERIIAIDKPTRKAIPPEYDLNKLLNRGKEISVKEELVRIYSPEDEFLFSFYNASAIKAL